MINAKKIEEILKKYQTVSSDQVQAVIQKSLKLKGLSLTDVGVLLSSSSDHLSDILSAAEKIKNSIYGNRIVFFAPLYISNHCNNDCLYCAFRMSNKFKRSHLSQKEIEADTCSLLKEGQKRVLLVAGESYPPKEGLDYVLNAIDTIYKARVDKHNIRRINVNIAPLDVPDFKRLKEKEIGTYQIFQETYHPETYQKMHPKGPKSDYEYRLTAIDRAFDAGFDDVGIGALFGLYDWKFEVLALMQHKEHLEEKFGMGPHTISVPRIEPASGCDMTEQPPYAVSDEDFKKLIAILRLAVPYTGIILSTRENPEMRRSALALGVSQISAGSKTNPGGYSEGEAAEQFSLGDHRSLDEVILDLLKMDYLPSFCTACYRLGRTGLHFMELAKPGDIRKKCEPNALLTFSEYLKDFASPEVKKLGVLKLKKWAGEVDNPMIQDFLTKSFKKIDLGNRDIFI